MHKLLAEVFGTFCLVLVGTGAAVVNEVSKGAVTHVGVSLVFGLVVMAMIYAVGDVSGAHLNPAVTCGFWAAKRFPAASVPGYVAAQAVGAIAASGLVRLMFVDSVGMGGTMPSGSVTQTFVLETALTGMLMFVVMAVSSGPKEKGIMAGIAIGGVIAFEALMGGPISGASMNPIRSLAPALISGRWEHQWVYVAAPMLGAIIGVACDAAIRAATPKQPAADGRA